MENNRKNERTSGVTPIDGMFDIGKSKAKDMADDEAKDEEYRQEFANAFYALRKEAEELPEMTLEEINEEIASARALRKEK